jgi:hypothetical protein
VREAVTDVAHAPQDHEHRQRTAHRADRGRRRPSRARRRRTRTGRSAGITVGRSRVEAASRRPRPPARRPGPPASARRRSAPGLGVSTSAGAPSATTPPVEAHHPRQVRRDEVEVVGGEQDRQPIGVQLAQHGEDVPAGREVDPAGRLVEQQQLELRGAARGRGTSAAAARRRAPGCAGRAGPPARAGRAATGPGASPATRTRGPRGSSRPLSPRSTTCSTVSGKSQSMCRAGDVADTPPVPDRRGGAPEDPDLAACRSAWPVSSRSRVVLPDPDGPTTPTSSPRASSSDSPAAPWCGRTRRHVASSSTAVSRARDPDGAKRDSVRAGPYRRCGLVASRSQRTQRSASRGTRVDE